MKKINFLGLEFNIIDDEEVDRAQEAGELHHYVVVRCVDTETDSGSPGLIARRRRTPCEDCNAICWIDPLSYEQIARLKHVIICQICFFQKLKEEGKDG